MELKDSQVEKLWGVLSIAFGILLLTWIIPSQVKAVAQSPWYNGPRLFPNILAGILIACGAFLFLMGVRKKRSGKDAVCCTFSKQEMKVVGMTLGVLIAYTLALSYLPLHYIFVTAAVMVGLMLICGQRNWKILIGVGLILPTIIYFSFRYGLKIRFP